jgi:hypothetical protein
MDKDKALDLALEALEYIHEGANNQGPHTGISWRCVAVKAEPAIKAIKQARALDKKAENARELGLDYEPEERYTYGTPLLDVFTKPAPVEPDHGDELTIAYMSGVHRGKELAAQRQWVGLTDEELELLNDCGDTDSYKFARAIEAKLKDKNGGVV